MYYLYSRVCVVFVGRVQGELDLEDLGSTQQQFLLVFCAPGCKQVQAALVPAVARRGITEPGLRVRFDPLLLVLVLITILCCTVLISRVPFHIQRLVLIGRRLWLGVAPFRLHPLSPTVAMATAKAVPKVGYLGDDQVNEGINQLAEHLEVLVFFKTAQTLPANEHRENQSTVIILKFNLQ